MPQARRILLIVLNAMVLVIALIVIAVVATKPPLQSTDSSHSEIIAKAESITDIPRLRAIMSRDDEYIRTLEHVVSQSTVFARAAFTLFSLLAAFNLVLLFSPQRPRP